MSGVEVRVRGTASAEEIAAVLAVVRPRGEVVETDPYRRWRRGRLRALRPLDGTPAPRRRGHV